MNGNWWLILLSFLLGALVTWLWSVRSVTRVIPASEYDRHLDAIADVDDDRVEVEDDRDDVRYADDDAEPADGSAATGGDDDAVRYSERSAAATGAAGVAGAAALGAGDDEDAPVKESKRSKRKKRDRRAEARREAEARRQEEALREEEAVFDAAALDDGDTQVVSTGTGVAAAGAAGGVAAAGSQLEGDDERAPQLASDSTQAIPTADAGAYPLGDEEDAGSAETREPVGDELVDPEESPELDELDGDEPYGPGSARAAADGSGPEGWIIKGNADSGLFHTIESPGYADTQAEVWFADEESARAAGFRHWDRRKR